MFDVLIIGLGAAGYTAAIYAARYRMKTLIVGGEDGGMGLTAAEVGNWPGIIDITGPNLMEKFKEHAKSFEEVTHKIAWVEKIEPMRLADGFNHQVPNNYFRATFKNGETVDARAVILATGSKKRKLGVPGEREFSGKGVTYCATCDAFFYKGKDVAVIGGGDSAVEGAAIAAQVARTVYLIHRRKEFRAEPYWVERVKARSNVQFVLENKITEIVGDANVSGVRLEKPWAPLSGPNPNSILALDGVFIEIGSDPDVALARHVGCELDAKGFIRVKPTQESVSVPGLFAAGDNTNESNYFAQFTTAAGEGAVAANGAFNYLQGQVKHVGGYMA